METIKTVVLALGGNAILPAGKSGTFEEQKAITDVTMAQVAELIQSGYRIVITHGNGPIVGNILLRNESAKSIVPPMPLDVCGADSEGGIGYMIQQCLYNEFTLHQMDVQAVTLITQVLVDPLDPAFQNPTKPIGPFYNSFEAEFMEGEKGWRMIEDSGRGYRRVVPSPKPLDIIEKDMISNLVRSGFVVIAAGGGGVPVIRNQKGLLEGVEVVIDKDRVSGLLAQLVQADELILVTGITQLAVDFMKPSQRFLSNLKLDELKKYYAEGQFPPGSMGPKIETIIQFLQNGGKQAIITTPENIISAIQGKQGTRIYPD